MEDCDVLGSSRSLYLYAARGAIVRRNKLHNGVQGWYNYNVSRGVDVEENDIRGEGPFATGGSYSTWGQPKVSRDIYTANNKYSEMIGFDREAFTSDGGGGAYFGAIAECRGERLTLAADPSWGSDDWTGAVAAIVGGHGMGQWRSVKSWSGRQVDLADALSIPPDSTSKITIVPAQLHYIFFRNHFRHTGVAVQLYGTAIEHIVAENDESGAGGFYAMALKYAGGVAPQLNVQFLGNMLMEGRNYRYGPDGRNNGGTSRVDVLSIAPSAVIGMVIRNNQLLGDTTLSIRSQQGGAITGLLVDRNRISDQRDLQIDPSVLSQVLVRQ